MKKITDYEILEKGCLTEGTREEAMQYYNAYRKHGTNQPHPIDVIFDFFEKDKLLKQKEEMFKKHIKDYTDVEMFVFTSIPKKDLLANTITFEGVCFRYREYDNLMAVEICNQEEEK